MENWREVGTETEEVSVRGNKYTAFRKGSLLESQSIELDELRAKMALAGLRLLETAGETEPRKRKSLPLDELEQRRTENFALLREINQLRIKSLQIIVPGLSNEDADFVAGSRDRWQAWMVGLGYMDAADIRVEEDEDNPKEPTPLHPERSSEPDTSGSQRTQRAARRRSRAS